MYTPDNVAGKRPDRATIVYTSKNKILFSRVLCLGGVEASLRRFAHYDYWSDKVRRSLLFDTKADYLTYGMSEKGILRLAESLRVIPAKAGIQTGCPIKSGMTHNFPNTAIITKDISEYKEALMLPSFEEISTDKKKFAEAFNLYCLEARKKHPRIIIQSCQGRY